MKYLILVIVATIFSNSYAGEKYPERPNYQIISSELDNTLSERESKFTFQVTANDLFDQRQIRYSIDNDEYIAFLDDNNEFSLYSKPGKHRFMILLTTDFHEIITDSIEIQARYHTKILLNFKSSVRPILVKKPVIYLYPERDMTVNVEIDPVGQLFYTYPAYNNGWEVYAKTNGELVHQGQTLNYLFWEAQMSLTASTSENAIVVSKFDAESKISAALDAFGLNSKEKADFLTYWIPEILSSNSENVHLQFLYNEDCDLFGELNVSPTPDRIARIYLLWSPTKKEITTQTEFSNNLSFNRTGFTVIEWGGAEIDLNEELSLR